MEAENIATVTLGFILVGILIVTGVMIFTSTSTSTGGPTSFSENLTMTNAGTGGTSTLTYDHCTSVTNFVPYSGWI